jgi:hypothetical protein
LSQVCPQFQINDIAGNRHIKMWQLISSEESQLMGLIDRAVLPLPYDRKPLYGGVYYRIGIPRSYYTYKA